jgi:APA family basic amino acid/polyamine antiporter
MPSEEREGPKLKKSLTLLDATTLAIGAIVGAGIFVVSGVASGLAGPAVILSIITAGVISAFTAFSYVKLSSAFPQEGGTYVYASKTVSPFLGFIAGWLWIFENIVAGATVSIGLGSYVASLFPAVPVTPTAILAVLMLTLLNLVGIKQSSIFNVVLVLLKISALFLFAIVGLLHLNFSLYQPFMPNGVRGVLNGAALIFFAYIGFGRPTTAAEEIENPEKTVPRSIVLSLALSTVIYILVGIVAIGLIPYQELSASGSPLADAAEYGIGIDWLKTFVSFAAVVATTSVLLTTLIGVSRVSFAMARDQLLPGFLTKLHGRYNTPYMAILVTGILTAISPILGSLKQTAGVTNFGSLSVYAIVNLSALFFLKKVKRPRSGSVVSLLFPALGMLSCVALLLFLDMWSWLIGILWIVIGAVYFRVKKR